eukprot:1005391-Pyramimonas_sp.AAC.1
MFPIARGIAQGCAPSGTVYDLPLVPSLLRIHAGPDTPGFAALRARADDVGGAPSSIQGFPDLF